MAFEGAQQGPTGAHAREVGQQSLRAVIQSNFDAMIVVDRDGVVLFANATAEHLLGRSAAELVGAQFGLPHTRGAAIEIEVGSAPRVAEMRVVELEWEGRPALLALLRDVASLRLAAIVEQSADAIFAFDHEGVITDWNWGAQRLLGHAPPDAIGRPVMMLVPENRRAKESERHHVALAGQSVDYETECVRADGTLVEVSMIISPIRATSGEVIAASAIARDVTECNRAERLQRGRHAFCVSGCRQVNSLLLGVSIGDSGFAVSVQTAVSGIRSPKWMRNAVSAELQL
jgi:PAS domain S-box-containing protein